MTTSTAIAMYASGERRFPSDPPSAVYANARGATPIAVAATNARSAMGVRPAA